MDRFFGYTRIFIYVLLGIAAISLIVMMVLTCADVIMRAFRKPISGTYEIVGFLAAVFLIPWQWPWILAAFLVFRALDIIKPYPLRRAEILPGGIGIMLDDLGAGLYTNLILHLIRIWL